MELLGASFLIILKTGTGSYKIPLVIYFLPSGLTFYGGLFAQQLLFAFMVIKRELIFWHLADAAAPALMIAYAIGRIGCQVAGDGDWGIYNSAYISDSPGMLLKRHPANFKIN